MNKQRMKIVHHPVARIYARKMIAFLGQNNNDVGEDDNLSTPWPYHVCQMHATKSVKHRINNWPWLFFSFCINPRAVVSPIFENFVKSIVEYGPGY